MCDNGAQWGFASRAIGEDQNVSLVQSQIVRSSRIGFGNLHRLERASADVVFDFNSGPCNLTGCPANTDMATGVLRLTDDYVYGDEVTPATFISMSYSSGDLTLDITNREALDFYGGLNADGSFNASDAFSVLAGPYFFGTRPGNFTAFGTFPFGPYIQNAGSTFTFTNVTAVPEPSTWAMMLIGFSGLG